MGSRTFFHYFSGSPLGVSRAQIRHNFLYPGAIFLDSAAVQDSAIGPFGITQLIPRDFSGEFMSGKLLETILENSCCVILRRSGVGG